MIKNTLQYRAPMWAEYVAEAADLDSSGSQTISNTGTLLAFTGATVPGFVTQAYALDITVDSTLRQVVVSLVNTDSWTVIVGKIQTALRALTTSTETVAIVTGKIKVTSATVSSTSSILIAAGTGVAAGGDLLAAITALGAGYIATVDTAIPGHEGYITFQIMTPSNAKNFSHEIFVKSSAGNSKSPFNSSYNVSTGYITVSDIAASGTSLVAGDKIIVVGNTYK